MIPKPHIAKWRDRAPWISLEQVEQDLVICRALVAIFSDDLLKEHLAFRGGTALHKLYLHPAPRYSEDIDLVQIREGPIKPILKQIDEIITFFDEERVVSQSANNNTIRYRFHSEYSPEVRLRLKLEINCREHFSMLGWQQVPFEVESEWFTGQADITTYDVHELLGTKLRALYQRKKGRDLFDLYWANQLMELNHERILETYSRYMHAAVDKPPARKQFLQNLEAKESDLVFSGDMEGLLRAGIEYDETVAFGWVKQELVERLD